jgi:Peptidase family M28
MRRLLFLPALLLLALPIALWAAPSAKVDGERALSFVKILADDSFAGRKSGLQSGRKAEEWVAERLREFGLAPGNGKSFFHELKATVTEELPTPHLSATKTGGEPRVGAYVTDYVTLTYSGAGEVEAGVVFCGYGIHAPERGRDDYAGLDVTGKIVMALRGKPAGSAFEVERQIGYKSSTAFDRGAVGFLLVEGAQASSGTIQEKFFREKLPAVWLSGGMADALFGMAGRPPLAEQVKVLDAGKPASFALEDVRVNLKINSKVHRDAVMRNVVGLMPGETDEVVVLGAHLDHLGVDGVGNVMNGADDNASGSGMLLEVARSVAASGRKFKRGILFVWFAGEEQGLLGSNAFVARPPVPLEKIAVMLNTDMCGQGKPVVAVGGTGTFPRTTGFLGNFDVPGIEVRRGWGSGGGSDHAPFVSRGVPAFFVHTTGPHPNYHSSKDDWQAIKPELLQATGRFIRTVAERAAASDEPFCRPNRRAEYIWRTSTVVDLFSGARAPEEMGIDVSVRWADRGLNEVDAFLTDFERKDADTTLLIPGNGSGQVIGGRRPAALLGLRGEVATYLCRPAHRLGVRIFAPFLGENPATEAEDLFAFAATKPAIILLEGAPADFDPAPIPAPILLPVDLALRNLEKLRERKLPWHAVYRLAPLTENKQFVHAEVAASLVGLMKSLGENHLLLTPGNPADPTYAAQAPTLHPGIVNALLEAGVTEERVRAILSMEELR